METRSSNAGASALPPPPRAVLARVLVLAGAVAIGLVLQHLVTVHLATLAAIAESDPIGVRRQLAGEVRAGGLALFALTATLGAWFVAVSRRARRLECFPPPGTSTWSARAPLTGAPARRAALVGMGLGAVLVAASFAGGALTWRMAEALLACRAGTAVDAGSRNADATP